MAECSVESMVGGTTPPQSDSGEISRVLVLNLLWQSKRCSRTAQDISVLTTPSLLSRATAPRPGRASLSGEVIVGRFFGMTEVAPFPSDCQKKSPAVSGRAFAES
jgi:hypothetical protein